MQGRRCIQQRKFKNFMKTMEKQYLIVQKSKKSNFESEVQSRMNEGWELQGGVSVVSMVSGELQYSQALFKV